MRLEVWSEEFVCHGTDPEVVGGVATVEGRIIVQAKGPDGSNWLGDRVLKIRLRKEKPGSTYKPPKGSND